MVMKMLSKSVVLLCLWASLAQQSKVDVDDGDLENLLESVLQIFNEIKSLRQQLEGVTTATEGLEKKIANAATKQDLEAIDRQLEKLKQTVSPKVAFSATLSDLQNAHQFIGPFSSGFTLAYKNVLTNVGNAYDQHLGVFTAPVNGVYHFTFVVFHPVSYGSPMQQTTGVSLLKNGVFVVSATDNAPGADTEDTSGNAVTLLLNQGDQISLQLWSGRRIYTDGNKRNTFSGHLLFTV